MPGRSAGFTRRTGVQTSVRMPEETDHLPFEIQRSLLRVIQEALTNTHQHAAASRVMIDLRFGAETLRVLDDGCGLFRGFWTATAGGPLLGMGIAGMKARMLWFGGCLRLLSDARGTMIVATLPLGSGLAGTDREPAVTSGRRIEVVDKTPSADNYWAHGGRDPLMRRQPKHRVQLTFSEDALPCRQPPPSPLTSFPA